MLRPLLVSSPDGGVDAVDCGQVPDGADADLAEVVQCSPGIVGVGCHGALCPAGEVVHGVGGHTERSPRRPVELCPEPVLLDGACAMESGQDGEPAEWGNAERRLPGAGAEGERLLGVGTQGNPSAGDDLAEAEPGSAYRTSMPAPTLRAPATNAVMLRWCASWSPR